MLQLGIRHGILAACVDRLLLREPSPNLRVRTRPIQLLDVDARRGKVRHRRQDKTPACQPETSSGVYIRRWPFIKGLRHGVDARSRWHALFDWPSVYGSVTVSLGRYYRSDAVTTGRIP